MNKLVRWLGAWTALWMLVAGVPEAITGEHFQPASWTIIFETLDWLGWLWPGLFILSGLLAVVGIFSSRFRFVAWMLAALAYLIWGLTSTYGWHTGQGGTWPGSSSYYHLSGTLLALALYGNRDKWIETKVAEVDEAISPAEIDTKVADVQEKLAAAAVDAK